MKTQFMLAVLAVCTLVVVANGQGTPFSYYADEVEMAPPGVVVVPVAPEERVITDVYLTEVFNAVGDELILLQERTAADAIVKNLIILRIGDADPVHFDPGIPVGAGNQVVLDVIGRQERVIITVAGYIPSATTSGIIPAVSSWGMLTLAIGVAAAGTVALRRKRQLA